MEAIFNTYYVLFKYQEVVKQYEDLFGISGNELASHFESLESDVNKIWNDFKKANELATLRYIAADDIKELKFRPNTKVDMNNDEKKEVKDSIASEEEGKYYLTQDIYDDLIREFDEAYQKVTQTAQQILDNQQIVMLMKLSMQLKFRERCELVVKHWTKILKPRLKIWLKLRRKWKLFKILQYKKVRLYQATGERKLKKEDRTERSSYGH